MASEVSKPPNMDRRWGGIKWGGGGGGGKDVFNGFVSCSTL